MKKIAMRAGHLVCCLPLLVTASAWAQNFVPDVRIDTGSLQGARSIGQASWETKEGTLRGKPEEAAGGLLILEGKHQDIGLVLSFRAPETAIAGILFRMEKSDAGTKGVLVTVGAEGTGSYEVSLDAQGRELSRQVLPRSRKPLIRSSAMAAHWGEEKVPGFADLTDAPKMQEQEGRAAPSGRGSSGLGPALQTDDWNTLEVYLDADLVTVSVNGRRGGQPAITLDRMMGYGEVALYVAGSGEVQFKDIALKDLNPKFEPKEEVSERFRMQRISDFYYGWCAAVADINQDGANDIIAGPFYYLGPDYTERREFTIARTYNPSTDFSQAMVVFARDFTGDGWPDILLVDQRPIWLFVNPRGESRRWDRYKVVANSSTELNLFKDIDGDGVPEVLYAGGGVMAYAKPNEADPTVPWKTFPISEQGRVSPHGMGVGDINGDGRMDVLAANGWWEQPERWDGKTPWKFHQTSFGSGGAEMGVYDVNGDGLNDVVTALSAHGWGLAWFEQKRDGEGKISFVQHHIMGRPGEDNAGGVTFSELHATNFADIDGDGVPDLIVGKRHFSHLESYWDPDPYGPAVLYVYRTVRNPNAPGGAEFVPELIHNRSGVGSHFITTDVDGDGKLDIVTSTNRGTFIFWGKSETK